MTLFSPLLPPKAISCGFSILCVGEEAFTHLLVLQRDWYAVAARIFEESCVFPRVFNYTNVLIILGRTYK